MAPKPEFNGNGLPLGWTSAKLSDVTVHVPNINPQRQPNREFAYVDISSICNKTYSVTDTKHFRGKAAPSRARRPVQPGDILFSNVRTYLRNIAIVPPGFRGDVCSTGFTVLRPSPAIEQRYLFRYVLTRDFISRVTPQQTGTHYPATSDRRVMGEELPLPPLPEQHRIIAKLEGLLAKVGTCQQRLERIPALLKRFRQSVLMAACSGKLTCGRRDVDRASDDIPDGWEAVEFKLLLCGSPQNGLYKPQDSYGSGVPIVRIDNYHDGVIDQWCTLKRVRLSATETRQYSLANDDLLINRVNSIKFLGKTALVSDLQEPCVFESNMMRVRVDKTRLSPAYAHYFLSSVFGVNELRKNAKHAVNQASINQQDVGTVVVKLPPLEEQKEITRRVKALHQLADQIEARYKAAMESVDRLTQSILAKAFRGELVPQNPKDEPAQVLLQRIKATCNGNGTASRGSRRRER